MNHPRSEKQAPGGVGNDAPLTALVSVLMPARNARSTIKEAMDDVLAQTHRNLELIVVDDGSSDDTAVIAAQVRDPRVRLVTRSSAGVAASLNFGISISRGEMLARMDADDRCHPERLEKLLRAFARDPRLAVVGTAALLWDPRADRAEQHLMPTGDSALQYWLVFYSRFFHGSTMYRRSAIEAVGGYRPELEPAEDYDLWLRLSERFRVGNLPELLYTLRLHDASVSAKRGQEQLAATARARRSAIARREGRADRYGATLDDRVAVGNLGELRHRFHRLIWAWALLRSRQLRASQRVLLQALRPFRRPAA
jgi:glycosyltransferase involved in cell wall biosynthesis